MAKRVLVIGVTLAPEIQNPDSEIPELLRSSEQRFSLPMQQIEMTTDPPSLVTMY